MTRLVLVGLRGSGKTSCGQRAASRLGASFVDVDQAIEARGRRIPEIFAAEGEAGFRAVEREVIAALVPPDPAVIATGGGAVLDPVNREALARLGVVVYLRADPRVLAARVTGSDRPPLVAGGPEAEARALLAAREPLYVGLARHTVDTDALTVDEVAARLVALARRAP